eukprot:TRINITY_DN55690_c1_g1_i2.p1 TRINITY_DN55690_c1_g1~~TRINITY_DN55690_c1_g1_i2.p1  ORF type:complete len:184 (+),score=16.78 TRINITY_DN55690_c1_g1_i2:46-552(+)
MTLYYQTYHPGTANTTSTPTDQGSRKRKKDEQEQDEDVVSKKGRTRTELYTLAQSFIHWARSQNIRNFKMDHEEGQSKKRRFYDVFGVLEAVKLSCRRSRVLGVWLGRSNEEIEKVQQLQNRVNKIRGMLAQCKMALIKLQMLEQQQIDNGATARQYIQMDGFHGQPY